MKSIALPWSYSKLSLYQKCPAAFKFRYIDKIKIPKSAAMQRGIDIHEKIDRFMSWRGVEKFSELGVSQVFAELFEKYKNLFMATMRGRDAKTEANDPHWHWSEVLSFETQVKVDENWNVVPNDSRNYWATFIYDMVSYVPSEEVDKRLKTHGGFEDVVATGTDCIIDFKTGKAYAEHRVQAAMYALSYWRITGMIPMVSFLYLDQGEIIDFGFTEADLLEEEASIRGTLHRIEEDEEFACVVTSKCSWCDFRKNGFCK